MSQALQAGGWTEDPGPAESDGAWWYDDNGGYFWQHDQSYSWAGAQNLFDYARLSGRRSRVFHWYDVRPGDIISVKYPPGGWDNRDGHGGLGHTLVVTGSDARGLLVSYHTSGHIGHLDKPLDEFKSQTTAADGPGTKYFAWRPK